MLTIMEEVKVWIARNKDYSLYIHTEKPTKREDRGEWVSFDLAFPIDECYGFNFPSIKWEDEEPTEAKITLTK